MTKRMLAIAVLAVFVAACGGSPVESAVHTLVEQVRLGDPLARTTYAENRDLLESADAVPLWIDILGGDESEQVRAWAAQLLGASHDERALPVLTDALGDSDAVRDAALDALGHYEEADRVAAFLDGLKSGNRDAEIACLGRLGRMQSVEAIPAITETAHSASGLIAKEAVNTLGVIGDPAAIQPLVEIASDSAMAPDLRRAAVRSLGLIHDQEAVDRLGEVVEVFGEEGAADLEEFARNTQRDLRNEL